MDRNEVIKVIKKRGILKELLDATSGNIEHSFVYIFLDKFPKRVKAIDIMYAELGTIPSWDDITDDFLKRLYDAFYSKAYSIKTIKHFFESIKATIKTAYNSGIIDTPPSKLFSSIIPNKGIIISENDLFLTNREIELIHNYKPKKECEKYAKKIFMLMCLCGCSYDDAIELSVDNMINGNIYYIKDNGTEVSVPMHKWISEYINQKTDSSYCKRTITSALKRIAYESGINDNYYYKNGSSCPRYKLIRFSTAQKTFATLLYNNGISIETIQSYMGVLQKTSMYYYVIGYEGPRKRIWRERKMERVPI